MALSPTGGGEIVRDEEPIRKPGAAIHGRSPTRIALERLRRDKVAMMSASVVAMLFLLGLFAPVLTGLLDICPDMDCTDTAAMIEASYPVIGPPNHGFTWEHPLGLQPNTGYDNLARLLYGLRTSLLIASVTAVLTTVLGIVVGLIAGFARGLLDRLLVFVVDVFMAFPFILGAMSLAPIITQRLAENPTALNYVSVIAMIGVLVLLGWMYLARIVRAEVLSMREREFIQAARVIGMPAHRILFREMLPNMVAPIVVWFSLSLPSIVAAEATLSYLGIGIVGTPSLGQTINDAQVEYDYYPLYLWPPIVTVMILVVSLNLLCDSIRDAVDPKTRR